MPLDGATKPNIALRAWIDVSRYAEYRAPSVHRRYATSD